MAKALNHLGFVMLLATSGFASASGPEFHGLSFKPGKPAHGCSLETSVMNPDRLLADLEHNLHLILKFPTLRYQVVGSTDDHECTGSACEDLSIDRARLVHAWLVRNGAPHAQLEIVGRGILVPSG